MANKMERAIQLLVSTNLTQREIARELDVAEETISRWKKKSEFYQLKEREERVLLNELAAPSIRILKQLLNSDNEYIRFTTAKDILNRAGYAMHDDLKREKLHFENKKLEAEARILLNEADKMTQSGETNELLKALIRAVND